MSDAHTDDGAAFARPDHVPMPAGLSLPALVREPARPTGAYDPYLPAGQLAAAAPAAPQRPAWTAAARPAPTAPAEALVWDPTTFALANQVEEPSPRGSVRKQPSSIVLPMVPQRMSLFIGLLLGGVVGVFSVMALAGESSTDTSTDYDLPQWLAAVSVVSTIATYGGLVLWLVAAGWNARRITPMATSPWMPLFVAVAVVSMVVIGQLDLEIDRDILRLAVVGMAILVGIYLFALPFMLRATARRVGAQTRPWSVVAWTPLVQLLIVAGAAITAAAGTDDPTQAGQAVGFMALVGVLVSIPVWAVSLWRAMGSFERAVNKPRVGRFAVQEVPDHLVYSPLITGPVAIQPDADQR